MMATISLRRAVASWSLAMAMALLALVAIPVIAIAGPLAALALFFGAYVAAGEQSVAAAAGFPVGLLLTLILQHVVPVSEFGWKTFELSVYAGLIGFIGSGVANIVNRRGALLTVFESVFFWVVFGVADLFVVFFGYFLASACQLFLPRGSFVVAGVLVICVAGGLAGAFIGICMWITGGRSQPFPSLLQH
jgi:hypothetical protein